MAIVALALLAACGSPERPTPSRQVPQPPAHPVDQAPKTLDSAPTAEPKAEPIERDLDALREAKTLRVLFTFNSTGYFIYRGETMGYEYELIRRFADAQKLTLKPVVVRDSKTLITALNRGDGDIVAAQLVRPASDPDVVYSAGLYSTSPVLVQRNPAKPAPEPAPVTVRAKLVAAPSELAGQRVHVPRSTPYRMRLVELNAELSNEIDVVEVDESSDRLIQELAEGAIGYTVAAENLAALKTSEYTNLVIKPLLGPPEQIAFAMRRNSPQLAAALDAHIEAARKSGLMAVLYRKYFLDRRAHITRGGSPYLTAETGRLSAYDDLFREFAKVPGWDWRLVAAQAYQESKFNPNAHSWAGAVGLMQLMPRTARELRVNPRDPRQSVEGAARYLWKLDQYWSDSISDEDQRVCFILASYNVGLGHVEDARRLATKHHDNPDAWDDVAYWLVRKSKREVYNDPVVKYGFARGSEPVTYVGLILQRYENYKEFVTAELPEPASASTPPE